MPSISPSSWGWRVRGFFWLWKKHGDADLTVRFWSEREDRAEHCFTQKQPQTRGCGFTKPRDVLNAAAGSEQTLSKGHQRCSLCKKAHTPSPWQPVTCFKGKQYCSFFYYLLWDWIASYIQPSCCLCLINLNHDFWGWCELIPPWAELVIFIDPAVLCQHTLGRAGWLPVALLSMTSNGENGNTGTR